MRIQILVLGVLAIACGDDVNPSDAGRDTAVDATDLEDIALVVDAGPSDTSRDLGPGDFDGGRDARVRDVGPNPARGHRPVMEVFDTDPCEPWETVTSPLQRELPTDTTPRLLWTYQPSLDPMYESSNARFETRVDAPVVSPDGTIWVRGPSYDQITQLNRDGTMREWFRVGGGNFEDEDNSSRLGDLSVAPNGDVIAIIFARNPEHGGVTVRIDPNTTIPHRTPASSLTRLELDPRSRVAISPDGMVYAISQNRVYGICHGDRHMWTLTNIAEDGERDFYNTGHFGGAFILPDGELLLSGNFAATYTVTGTEVTSELLFDAVDTSFYRFIAAWTPNRLMLQAYDPSSESGARFDVGVRLGPDDWRRQRTTNSPFAMNVVGELHLRRSDGAKYRWEPIEDVSVLLPTDVTVGQTDVWLENGGWLTATTRDDVSGLYSLDVAGETRWVLNPFEGDRGFVIGGQERVLDERGVYYRVVAVGGAFIQLVAIQTDVLPPPNTMCLDYFGCNPHRDRYLRPE